MRLTWHPEEESLPSAAVGLKKLAVLRPVQVSDEAGASCACAHPLVALIRGINVHKVVVGAHSQELATWGELHLVDHLFAILDVNQLRQISGMKEVTKCP